MSPDPLALFVGAWLPYSETFVYDQVRQQQRFSAQVFARGCRAGAEQRFPYPRVTSLGNLESAAFFFLGRSATFTAAMRELRPRVVHAHFGLNGALARPLAEQVGAPLVVSFHGHDVPGLLQQNRFRPRYYRYQRTANAMFDYAALLLCASRELAEMLVRQRPRIESKVRIHELGIDLERFPVAARDDSPLRVLMVGRMVEKKGMAYGMQAFARLRRDFPEATLAIVGDGPLRPALVRLSRELGLQDAVTFCGALAHEAVRREMARASVLLAPSVVARDGDRESGMLVVKEAGASGLPVVASQHGGIPEIVVDGETGWLVPERDVDALAQNLLMLAADPGLRARAGEAARARMAERYDTVKQNRTLEALLASTL
jgi:glycosyltransferase involved in cell wall biosynthesis